MRPGSKRPAASFREHCSLPRTARGISQLISEYHVSLTPQDVGSTVGSNGSSGNSGNSGSSGPEHNVMAQLSHNAMAQLPLCIEGDINTCLLCIEDHAACPELLRLWHVEGQLEGPAEEQVVVRGSHRVDEVR